MKYALLAFALVLSLSPLGCSSSPKAATPNREPGSARTAESTTLEALDRVWADRFSSASFTADFRAELRKELARRVRIFNRPISVYHYGGRGTAGLDAPRGGGKPEVAYTTPLELQPPELRDYYREYSSLFRDGPMESQVGPGIYAAVDPIQSESYAKNPWFLLELLVPAGAKYLDLRPMDTLVLSKEFVEKWLMDESSGNYSQYGRYGNRFAIGFTALLRIKTLREQIGAVLDDLDVDALAYSWSRPAIQICSKRGLDQPIAFNFINPKFLDHKGRYRVYVQALEPKPAAEKISAYSRMLDQIQSGTLVFTETGQMTYTYSNGNGGSTTSTQPATPAKWSIGMYKMRVLIYPWAKVLGKKYVPALILKKPEEAEKLYDDTAKLAANSYSATSYEINVDALAKRKLNTSNYGNTTTVGDSFVLTFDPFAMLKKNAPKEYARQVAEIENSIFGCSEKYPQENETPTF